VSDLHRIYTGNFLERGLAELKTILGSPAGMHARLEEQGRRFDRHLAGLKRLRNSRSHMEDYCLDHIRRFERVQATGDIDALFVEVEY
jgi:hypothetical protein